MLRPSARRALAAFLPLLWPALTACGSHETTPFDGARAMADVEAICKLGPRPSGSPALEQASQFIQKRLTDLGLKPQVQRWREEAFKLDMQNIWVQIDGDDPERGPILAIAAHFDSKNCQGHPDPAHNFTFVGAIDGTGGPAVLLELARQLKDRKKGPNLWLVWFDGEENIDFEWTKENGDKALFGSRHFVKEMSADKARFPKGLNSRMKALVLLDLVGDKNPKVDREYNSNTDLMASFEEAGRRMGESARMFEFTTESGYTDDHLPFIQYGVAAIDLIDFHFRIPPERDHPGQPNAHDPRFAQWWHTDRDTPDKMSPFGLKFFGDLVLLGIPEIEKRFYGK